ncbi:MAG: PAS domain S-box protein, partial [Chloroflexi bacterium]|nr:PAS domain S-box protein [Chloroflexota bacterium]
DDMQAVIHLFDEAVRTHPQDLAVLQVQRRDGSTVFIEASTKLVQRRNEAPEILVILRDITERQQAEEETKRLNKELMEANAVLEEEITERKRAEEALKQSEMRFRALFENASDGASILNADGTIAYAAPSNERILGFEAGGSGAVTLFDQIHPDDKDRLAEDLSTIIQEPHRKVTSVYRALHKDGQWRKIEATGCNLLDDPHIQGIVANFRDVTERMQAEEALKDSEEKFRNILESADDEIIYLDEAGTILDVNDRVNDIFGYSREELIGKNFTDFNFINSEGMEDLLNQVNKAVRGDNIPLTELVALRKDGSTVSVELSIRTVQASSGKQGLLVIVRDILERKQAEEALRESEDKYRKVVELCSDGIVIIQDGIIKFANPRMGEIMDDDLGEGLNTPFSDHVDPGEISKLANYHQKQISGEEVPSMYETTLKHKDGSRVFIEFNGSLIVYKEKAAVLGFVRDITGRKQAEEALKESEAHWRALVENAPFTIISVDSEGTILATNRIVPGLTSEEVIGNTIYNFIVPEHHDLVRESFSHVLSSGEAGGYEIRGVGPDGRDSWWETQLGPVMHEGTVAAITLITTDITERKESEERILRHNRELAALNDIVQTVSQSIDLDGILNAALDKTLEILNVKHGAIAFVDKESESLDMRITRGASDNELESIPTIELVDDVVGQVAKSGETIFVESVGDLVEQQNTRTQNLVYDHHLKSAIFVPLNARGRILGVMCVATQNERVFTPEERGLVITISHQISTAVENSLLIEEASRTEALEELDKLRTGLLASVSHELRTPLTSIKGLASTLTQPDIEWDTDTQQEFLKIIDRESDILTHIVEDLMQMSQIEAGIMNLDKTQSSISSVVNQLSDQLGKLVKNHQFEIIVPRGLPMIDADEIRLGEVITNLVANAASYSEEGTKITLEAKTVDNHIMVGVSDEGIGISAEHVDKVFDRFYRLESGVARRRGGTGLGLSICKGIVEAHNGKIWVDTRNDQGSKFSFCLPISNDLEMESVESN